MIIYTRQAAWNAITKSSKAYSKCPLWDASYDDLDDLLLKQTKLGANPISSNEYVAFASYGGWKERMGKQIEARPGQILRC